MKSLVLERPKFEIKYKRENSATHCRWIQISASSFILLNSYLVLVFDILPFMAWLFTQNLLKLIWAQLVWEPTFCSSVDSEVQNLTNQRSKGNFSRPWDNCLNFCPFRRHNFNICVSSFQICYEMKNAMKCNHLQAIYCTSDDVFLSFWVLLFLFFSLFLWDGAFSCLQRLLFSWERRFALRNLVLSCA